MPPSPGNSTHETSHLFFSKLANGRTRITTRTFDDESSSAAVEILEKELSLLRVKDRF